MATRIKIPGLRTISDKSDGRYRAVICLLLRHQAKDFSSGQTINTSLLLDEKIEDHHVFPLAYLLREEIGDHVLRNSVLNRALISKSTNRTIRDSPPSEYVREMERSLGSAELNEIMQSQLLPTDYHIGGGGFVVLYRFSNSSSPTDYPSPCLVV